MGLRLITGPAAEPVSLLEAKAQLSLPADAFDHDVFLERLIKAARSHTERRAQRAWIDQTWELTIDAFPTCGKLLLPRPRLSSVASIIYVDSEGTSTTLSSDLYQVIASSEPGAVVPSYGESWPSARCQPDAVAIRYVAGYGATAASVPEDARHAMLLLIGHWFENREGVFTGSISKEIELGVKALLDPFRVGIVPGGYDV